MSPLFAQPVEVRLKDQLSLLDDLCALYDSGKHRHALYIASRVSVLVEVLRSREGGQLIKQNKIDFPSPISGDGSGSENVSPLFSKVTYVDDLMNVVEQRNLPLFSAPHPVPTFRANLGRWLSQPSFYLTSSSFMSRELLISLMRNKDGGSHKYSPVGNDYDRFANDMGAISINTSQPQPVPDPFPAIHTASMRQIAHEIAEALDALRTP